MKKHKLIENRPELTPEQISQGMNFAAVKGSVLSPQNAFTKVAATKGFIEKVLVVAGLLTSSVIVYNSIKRSNIQNGQSTMSDTMGHIEYAVHNNETVRMATTKHLQITASTTTKLPTTSLIQQITPNKAIATPDVVQKPVPDTKLQSAAGTGTETTVKTESLNSIYKLTEPFKASPNAKCVIISTDALDNIGSAAATPVTMNCNACEFEYIHMAELESKPNLKLIWLTVTVGGKSKFNLESHLKNISLETSNGKHIYPVAIAIGAPSGNSKEAKLISDKTKVKELKVIFTNRVDVFMFFDGASPGDHLIFDDFVLAEVEE